MTTTIDIFKDAQHLDANVWQKVNRKLLAKSLAELMREDIAKPKTISEEADGLTRFKLETDKENIHYTFSACLRFLNYWHVEKESIRKHEDGQELATVDVPDFFIELQHTFGMDSFTLTHYVEELSHTLYADAFIHSKGRLPAGVLVDSDFQTIEHHVADGHPWVIVNKGRIGFDSEDYGKFAPEADKNTRLAWIAAHKSRASLRLMTNMDRQAFYEKELGEEKTASFKKILTDVKVNTDDYVFIPVHSWQWQNKLVLQFASDIAEKYLIPLGVGEDLYSPQQSIRTFFNQSHPHKHYVKTTISILNTSHIRGLSPKQLSVAPRLTAWLKGMLESDPHLQDMGLVLLGEVASISYSHPKYSKIVDPPYQYNEFLGALWRESPVNFLKPGENLMTMASLLYVDDEGKSLVQELIERSGLSTEQWLTAYFNAYLKPILQIYYQHSICIDPHGQNVILVLKDYVPTRIALQDFVGDILLNEEAQEKLPREFSENMFVTSPNPENAPLNILIAVFDAFFRYLSNVLHTSANYPEASFWQCVYQIILEHQQEHPELKHKFEKYDIFIPEFKRLVFNSRRLFHGYDETSGFPHMRKSGLLPNPMYRIKTLEMATLNEN
ncbi:IucA/IucC family siderophore biosynthesis protein [Sinomicrobium kalidii]|uniref:IucA/IucC family protein n=1 Tax=Sinomicrobium kalidii TaxID=2900738 RepID=UPI001E3E245D|nr:IucA/IucC family siderophore biosynthesis protein [Sinomicrobium kalidii]UGU17581.1 IucA/IucC family siderophore biosynthesis protein [Sinomicrobium kalidii]